MAGSCRRKVDKRSNAYKSRNTVHEDPRRTKSLREGQLNAANTRARMHTTITVERTERSI